METHRIPKAIYTNLIVWFLILALPCILLATETYIPPAAKLMLEDCAKCHSKPPEDISADGRKHKTEIGCQDCHSGHPPTTRKIIPLCSQCHEGKPHFRLAACISCHTNPHAPLKITYGTNVTDACVTCHAGQIVTLRGNTSKHTLLACSFCHTSHGKIPNCTQCHKTHFTEQTAADCKKCHQAHSPKNVVYNDKTPSKDCAACHKKAYELLTASTFKHKNLSCAACHQKMHKMVPQCATCHGARHPAAMLAKFPNCGFCHSIAHDLNTFNDVTKPAPKAAIFQKIKNNKKK